MGRINYYVAVFIDILGQGDKLSKIKRLPATEEEKEELFKSFRETAGAVKALHSTFEDFFEAYGRISPDIQKWLDSTTPEIKEQFLKSRELNLQYLNFSDTVVLYFTLDRENNKAPLRSVYTALSSAAATFVIMLSSGVPLRGAINIGLGTELEKSGVYGPILHNLHHLESKVAEYPRIIVGDELIKMISDFENEPTISGDMFQTINKATISSLKALITMDNDGKNILHYLDKSISDSLGDKKKDLYQRLNEFVDKQYRSFSDNNKLHKRYQSLKYFIRRNKSAWQ